MKFELPSPKMTDVRNDGSSNCSNRSLVVGLSLFVNFYLEIKFHKINRVTPPPPLLNAQAEIKQELNGK